MSYQAGELVMIVSGTCLALGTLATTIINAINTSKLKKQTESALVATIKGNEKTDQVITKQESLGNKLEEVHQQTNSRMTRLETDLHKALDALATKEIQLFQAEIVRKTLADEAAAALKAKEAAISANTMNFNSNQSELNRLAIEEIKKGILPESPGTVVVQNAESVEIVEKKEPESKIILP